MSTLATLALLCAPVLAADEPPVKVRGFVSPAFKVLSLPQERPADQLAYGMDSSTAGVIFKAAPVSQWKAKVYLRFGAASIDAVTDVDVEDTDNDGTVDDTFTNTTQVMGDLVREATVTWQPVDALGLRMGRMRIPFTSQQQSPDTELLFPTRAGPNDVFLKGTDMGVLAEANLADERVLGSVGVFNGEDLPGRSGTAVGLLYAARADIHPLGAFSAAESGNVFKDFRLGFGGGVMVNPYRTYDSTSYDAVQVMDVRTSVSARMGVAGLYLAGEFLRRYQVDSLSSRPLWATGAYGSVGYTSAIGLEPVFRAGWADEDQSFDTQRTIWLDLGANLYPAWQHKDKAKRDKVKITAQYVGEQRVTEKEQAHGGLAQVQVKF